jgi:hypothetical protein
VHLDLIIVELQTKSHSFSLLSIQYYSVA